MSDLLNSGTRLHLDVQLFADSREELSEMLRIVAHHVLRENEHRNGGGLKHSPNEDVSFEWILQGDREARGAFGTPSLFDAFAEAEVSITDGVIVLDELECSAVLDNRSA